jgi:AcrR family transcriptional regulator
MLGGRVSEVLSDYEARDQRILDAAAELIVRYGYDKTTMSDVAEAVGVSRGILYLHFDSKDKLFESLFYRETLIYAGLCLERIEADPRGGTIGGIYRAVLYAINNRPLMQAIMRRDRRVFGNYLRKPGNMFAFRSAQTMWADTIRAMQAVGAVRSDADTEVLPYIMEIMSYGMISISDIRDPDEMPPFDVLLETMANIMDQLLTPDDGGNHEAGKALIRQLFAKASAEFKPPGQHTEGDSQKEG